MDEEADEAVARALDTLSENVARSFANLCGALTAAAENANRPSHKKLDPMQAGLAYADCWLDNILKGRLKLDQEGEITFKLDE